MKPNKVQTEQWNHKNILTQAWTKQNIHIKEIVSQSKFVAGKKKNIKCNKKLD